MHRSCRKNLAPRDAARFSRRASRNPSIHVNPQATLLALIAPAFALLSCAVPKAIVVEETGAKPKEEKKEETAATEEPATPAVDDDGIRLPDMLGMPGEGEFRSSLPRAGGNSGSGAVIARPPVE